MRPLVQTTFAPPAPELLALDEPLFVHRREGAPPSESLVVFVHGLGGSRYGEGATWGDFPRLLYEDLPRVDVGLYGYTTLFGRLKFWRSVDLEVEADRLAVAGPPGPEAARGLRHRDPHGVRAAPGARRDQPRAG